MSKKSKKDVEDDEDCCADEGTKDIESALADLDEEWEDAEEESYGDLPNDTYQVKIEKAFINTAKSSGRLQCNWECTIVSGKYKGRKVWFRNGLDNQRSIGFFKGNLAPLGVEYPKKKPSKKLPALLEELEGTHALLKVSTSGDFTNGYFQKALDSDDIEDDDCCCEDCDCEDCKPAKKKKDKKDEKPAKKGKKPKKEEPEDEDCDDDEDEKPKKKGKKSKDDDDDDDEDAEEEEGIDTDDIDAEDIDKKAQKRIKALCKAADADWDDYKNKLDLLADIGEYYGLKGKYKSLKKLLEAVEAAAEKGDDDDDDCCEDDCDCDC